MDKTKLTLCLLLLTAFPFVSSYCQSYSWKRVPMDGHRSAPGKELSVTADKEWQLLRSCDNDLASLRQVVGHSSKEMDAYRPQSPLGNFVADLLRVRGEQVFGVPCDLSLINVGGIRQSMPKGDVIMDDIVSMFPFRNTMVLTKIRGDRLLELFNLMARQNWEVFSGATVVVDGDTVLSMKVGGKPLDLSATYTLLTHSFLYDGGDGISIRKFVDPEQSVESSSIVVQFVLEYLKSLRESGKDISSDVDDRIVFASGVTPVRGAHEAKTSSDVPFVNVPAYSGKAKKSLTILHTNDTHSTLDPIRSGKYAGMGGVVERAAFIDSVRKADGWSNVLLLDAGDYSQGTSYFTTFGGSVEVEAMNIMEYDVAAIGNHEWDNGSDAFSRRLQKASFESVLCNYQLEKKFKGLVKPYTIVRRGGFKIGIIGTLANVTEVTDSRLVKGLAYTDPVGPVNEIAGLLKEKKGCDIVIMLSHCGLESRYINDKGDVQIAPFLKNVDIIIGGHTHSNLKSPLYVEGADAKPIMIVTDYCKGVYVGQIDCYR